MLEYELGKGSVVLNQLNIIDNLGVIPQAEVILKNIVSYGLNYKSQIKKRTILMASEDGAPNSFLRDIGMEYTLWDSRKDDKAIGLSNDNFVIVDLA